MAHKGSAESDRSQVTIISPFSRSPFNRLHARSKPINIHNSRLRYWSTYTKERPQEFPAQDAEFQKRYLVSYWPVVHEVDDSLDSFHFPQRCEM